ncbi:DUF72 domain-containing protein [Echinicola vietnamensis]|uniref:DUF72 domain-containing protein n=1 Tax=Echinicola vietnamensis (strain DSM 17526 / LMG 23754 / KMM 6221) TaxID=926556 RepID=L0G006_ECHVK|nr:DUF72 domain-containing protein [Echinicola vietnamensis]AGA78346.1 hypothetical protein Echvi_2094 [Echinicola vietnamensis DSM 17526]
MKFGSVEDPSSIDFTLPPDHPETKDTLQKYKSDDPFEVYVGCAKWNRADLKGFYPRGTKDELTYYATQFNSIELNATFYSSPSIDQVKTWAHKTPKDFRFFPKIPNTVSHFKRLINVEEPVMAFADAVANFEDRLGMAFLQMHNNFKPKDFDRVEKFIEAFPPEIPLALELRNEDWFADEAVLDNYCKLLVDNQRTNIIVDTAGRRDMLHMRLTSDAAFIRYVGANADSDYSRLDDWLARIVQWRKQGLKKLYFFVHQNVEKESPLLSAYFIKKLNKQFGLSLKIPNE